MATESANKGHYGIVLLLAGALLSLITLFVGCQSINPLPRFGVGGESPEEERIERLMAWHSGRVEVYREFRTVFTARAVYLSDEIQKRAADWEARSKLMSPEERADFEKRFLGEEPGSLKVLVGFYTPEEQLNDLSRENSVWTPYIRNPDNTVTRATCLDIAEDEARIYMRFLKWDLSWSKLYLLCFPFSSDLQGTGDGWISLVISGRQGQGMIRLRFDPPDEKT